MANLKLSPGVVTGNALKELFAYCKEVDCALPAVNVIGSSSANAALQSAREAKAPILLLMSITGIVLLIACANIANLLLARAANRTTEMAVRLSLGATRRQVLNQLLTESVVLAFLGGAVSIVFAHWTLASLSAMLPPEAAAGFTRAEQFVRLESLLAEIAHAL